MMYCLALLIKEFLWLLLRLLPWRINTSQMSLGNIVGAPLNGKVLVIDDVITAGTAIREVMEIIAAAGASLGGVVITFNRQEIGQSKQSSIDEIQAKYQIPVISIINLQDLLEYLSQRADMQTP